MYALALPGGDQGRVRGNDRKGDSTFETCQTCVEQAGDNDREDAAEEMEAAWAADYTLFA